MIAAAAAKIAATMALLIVVLLILTEIARKKGGKEPMWMSVLGGLSVWTFCAATPVAIVAWIWGV